MAVNLLGKLRKAFVGSEGLVDAADVEVNSTDLVGALNGSANAQIAINRIDGTGIGADLFQFTGTYSAQSSNISEWFGNKQLVRMRCTGRGGSPSGSLSFDLPGTTALETAFDALSALGIAEVIRFRIEYTGDSSSFLNIRPRVSPSPQITGTTNIIVRSNVVASLEITRTSGTISDYIFTAITQIAAPGSSTFDSLKLINPATTTWDASENGSLPSSGVVKGNAYRVINAPSDGSGRFDEVMYTDDWVVWNGETFTAWATEPHQWFVISAHDVRRITALENEFLTDVAISDVSSRNAVNRGADYADSAAEIRIKIYDTVDDYDAADLNTTGQIDEFTQASDTTGVVAVRLAGTQSSLSSTLPNLYLYLDDTLLGNFDRDLSYLGDFGAESDYILTTPINYVANEVIRVYEGTTVDRYNAPNLDISESNLTDEVQAKLNSTDHGGGDNNNRLTTLESKMAALFPLTPDVDKLTDFADIYNDTNTTETVTITDGYSLIADYRSDSDRYESTGVTYDNTGTNVVTYTGLGTSYNKGFGFTIAAPSDKTLLWVIDDTTRIPYVDITSSGNIRVNNYTTATAPGQHIENESHTLTKSGGSATTLSTASDSVQTFTITPYPSGALNATRSLQVGIDVFINGSDTTAGHLQSILLPDTNVAQSRQEIQASIFLGPIYNSRTVDVTFGYELRVSGSDYLVDFTLISAPSDVTIDMEDVFAFLSYTSAATTTRTDNYVNLTDPLGDYTFTGAVDLLLTFHPIGTTSLMEVVPVVINSSDVVDELNDATIPRPAQDFASVEIPDNIGFTTFQADHFFIHRDLSSLLRRRGTKWAYGLALLEEVSEQQITEAIDFTQGIVLTSPNTTRYKVTVADDGTLKTEIVT